MMPCMAFRLLSMIPFGTVPAVERANDIGPAKPPREDTSLYMRCCVASPPGLTARLSVTRTRHCRIGSAGPVKQGGLREFGCAARAAVVGIGQAEARGGAVELRLRRQAAAMASTCQHALERVPSRSSPVSLGRFVPCDDLRRIVYPDRSDAPRTSAYLYRTVCPCLTVCPLRIVYPLLFSYHRLNTFLCLPWHHSFFPIVGVKRPRNPVRKESYYSIEHLIF
ncbi:hypothetical protein SAMN02982931_04728 [Bauldia litoralis]|uniref:Uncharacterized protein n=1 Tax=Bauldia litoralis TaxID=665467 RepID=A0A1G6EMY7_9HYPH|nr:hypothetical protein SAMN02982931_04728 [Bauldia litoralis]